MTDRSRPLAVVTGASSGLGAVFAKALAGRGFDLLIIARRAERLQALKESLQQSAGVCVDVLAADLIDDGGFADAVAALQRLAPIDLLVNCAGFGTYADFASVDAVRIRNELTLDLVVPVGLTRAVLPDMLARRKGVILNISSMAGFLPIPRHVTYCTAKAGLTRFTEALHGELAGTGVAVQALCPGPVPTEFFGISGYDIEDVPPYLLQSAEDCVEAALRFLGGRKTVSIPQAFVRTFVAVLALIPLDLRVKILGGGPEWLNRKKRRLRLQKDEAQKNGSR